MTPRRLRLFALGLIASTYALAWLVTLAFLHPDLGDFARRWREGEQDEDDDDVDEDVARAVKRINVSKRWSARA